MVTITMSALISMTVHCARCHDHKFDPIRQDDYYSLQAVFAGVDRADRPFDRDPEVFAARRSDGEPPCPTRACGPWKMRRRRYYARDREARRAVSRRGRRSMPPIPQDAAGNQSSRSPSRGPARKALVKAALPPADRGEMDRLHAEFAGHR